MTESLTTDFKDYYFIGTSHAPAAQMSLNPSQIQGLMTVIQAPAAIVSCLPVDPLLAINAKGFTAWQLMFALVKLKNPEDIDRLAKQETSIYIPRPMLEGGVGNFNKWPTELLEKFDFSLDSAHLFILPFSIHTSASEPRNLTESLKSPDGSLEILGLHEFSHDHPSRLLAIAENVAKFVRSR